MLFTIFGGSIGVNLTIGPLIRFRDGSAQP